MINKGPGSGNILEQGKGHSRKNLGKEGFVKAHVVI
jgi:hypothetical protein